MPVLAIGDRRVSYEECGAGPIALLIHGSPGNAKAWSRVAERLADRYRVVMPDLPGYGETSPQPEVGHASELIEGLIWQAGPPAVLAGHSYGGVVALAVALRAKVPVATLALFEPVALEVLPVAGESAVYSMARAVFDDYIAAFEGGDGKAVRKMIDFWFGQGAFEKLPEPASSYLIRETASNIRDVQATFRERYSLDALRSLHMPVVVAVGDRSPDVTQRIARVIVDNVASGSLLKLEKANHALTTTHVEAVAQIIAGVANGARP